MRIAEDLAGREFSHVVPIFDAGQDAESDFYFVVMARAQGSLQDELDKGKIFNDREAVHILLETAKGLNEVVGLVHRDLKPDNILKHNGKWSIADFGIARFVEESTSLRTLKGCLTREYAAPEQWRSEHATRSTDIYAMGCIGYALLTGAPPFRGSPEELQEQHLEANPPDLGNGHAPRLRSLLTMMLRKVPAARPSLERVVSTLRSIVGEEGGPPAADGFNALAQAGAEIAAREAAQEAREEQQRTARERRDELAREAFRILDGIMQGLFQRIQSAAPAARREIESVILLGDAFIRVGPLTSGKVLPSGAFRRCGWDVLVGVTIQVVQKDPNYAPGSSLWYMARGGGDDYRWYEVSYWAMGQTMPGGDEPFALDSVEAADEAAGPGISVFQIAWGPEPIDDEDSEDFCNRWADLLARASRGRLQRPRQMPLPGGL